MSTNLIAGNELGLLDTSFSLLNRNDTTGNHIVGGGENLFINVANGNLLIQHQDTYMPSLGQDFNLVRTYNVRAEPSDAHQHDSSRWYLSNWVRLTKIQGGQSFEVQYGDGSVFHYEFDQDRGLYVSTDGAGAYETIEDTGAQGNQSPAYILTRADQSQIGFTKQGRMEYWQDANGVRTEFSYQSDRISQVRDDNGHVINYEYSQGRLVRVVDESEGILVEYVYSQNKLVEVIDRFGHSTKYTYNNQGYLIKIELPEQQMVNGELQTFGHREINFEYDYVNWKGDTGARSAVITKIIDAEGGITTFDYTFDMHNGEVQIIGDGTIGNGNGNGNGNNGNGNNGNGNNGNGNNGNGNNGNGNNGNGNNGNGNNGNGNNGNGNSGPKFFNGGSTRVVDALGNARAYSNDQEYRDWRTANGFYVNYNQGNAAVAAQAELIRDQHAMSYTYLSNGYISEVVDQQGFHTLYEYNQNGDLIAMTNNNGWAITNSDSNYYRDLRKAQGIVDLAGEGKLVADLTQTEIDQLTELYASHYEYDSHGNLTRLEDNNGSITTFTYTDFDKVSGATSAEGHSLVTDDSDYSRAQRLELGYAEFVAGLSQADKDAILALYTSTFEYDTNTNLIRQVDAGGDITEYVYDVFGNQTQRTIYLDASDLSDPGKQQVTQYEYDVFGNLIKITDGEGNVTQTSYDHFGNMTQSIDGNGGVTNYTYDADNRLLSVTDPEGNITAYTYDAVGNRISTTDAKGRTITRVYDLNNRLIQVLDPSLDASSDRVTNFSYDILGNQTVVVDAEGRETQYIYNARRELIEVISEEVMDLEQGVRRYNTTYQYDGLGQRIVVNDNNGNETQLVYNEDGLLHQQTDAAGHSTRFEYDDNNNKITIISGVQLPEARRQIIRFSYDEEDQLVRNVDPEGNVSGFEYDAVGNRVALIDARAFAGEAGSNFTTRFEYDLDNRLIREILPEVTDPTTGQPLSYVREYQYDANNNRIAITNENGEIRRFYFDQNNRQILLEDENGIFTAFTYDSLNNRSSIHIGVEIARDSGGNLVFVDPGQTQAQIDNADNAQVHTFTYDEFNQLIRQTDGMGNALAFNNTALYQQLRVEMGYAADATALSQTDVDALLESRSQHFNYDRLGNLLQQIDHLDRSNTFTYDSLNRVISGTNAEGNSVDFSYDGNNNLVWQRDELGRITRFTYDSRDRLLNNTEADGSSVQATGRNVYDEFGNLIEQIRADGSVDQRSVRYEYDLNNRLTRTINEEGHAESYEYDAVGNRIAVTDGRNNRSQFVYDALNRTIKIIDAKSFETQYEYDGVGNRIAIIDANGHLSRFDFDPANRLISTTLEMDEGADRTTSYQYDVRGNRIEMRTAVGTAEEAVTTFEYNAENNLVKVIDAEGGVSTSEYDAVYNLVRSIDAQGNTSSTEFDALNRAVKVTDALGGVTSFQYDAVGNQLNVTDANGNSVSYVYDERDRNTIMRVDTDGVETHYSYDDVNNRTSIKYAAGLPEEATETFEYYADDQLKARIDGEGNRSEYQYDEANNRTLVTDPSGNITRYDYDQNNLVEFITDAEGHVVQYKYDGNGNRVQVIDGEGNRHSSYYNAANLVKYAVDGEGFVTHFEYNANGNLVKQTLFYDAVAVPVSDAQLAQDPVPVANAQGRDQVQQFEYDLLNRITARIDGEGYRTEFEYDAVGNRTLLRQFMTLDGSRLQETRSYYDNLYRVTQMVSAQGYLTVMSYDALGNMTRREIYDTPVNIPLSGLPVPQAGDVKRITQLAYDHNNRVVSEISPSGIETTHVYDKRGNRTITTEAAGTVLARINETVYDRANRVSDIINAKGTAAEIVTHFELYANGQIRRQHDAYGTTDVVVTDFVYDGNNRLIEKRMPFANNEQVIETYAYDAAGNQSSWTRAFGTAIATIYYYEYDANNRLVAEDLPFLGGERVLNTYQYDAAGNRIVANYAVGRDEARAQSWDYDNDNRMILMTDGEGVQTAFEYDGADNQIRVQEAINHSIDPVRETVFEYDLENRLLRETSAEGYTIDYEYDVLNNRTLIRQLVDQDTNRYAETHQYFDILGRQTHTINAEGYLTVQEYDALDRVVARTLYSDRVSVPAAGLPQAGMDNQARTTSFLYNSQNRVISETRADGFITEYGYDVRGNRRFVFEGVSYDAFGVRQGELRATEYRYSDSDQITDEIRALGSDAQVQTHFELNAYGHVTAQYDAYQTTDERVTHFQYDDQDRVILESITVTSNGLPFDIVTQFEYNAFGELRFRTDGLGSADERVIEFRYDDVGQVTDEVNGENEVIHYAYDALGNRIEVTNGFGSPDARTTRYEFDLDNRRIAMVNGEGVRTEYTYDGYDNLTSETMAVGTAEARITSFAYDLESRLVLQTSPLGATTEYVYDVLGNQTKIIQLHDYDNTTTTTSDETRYSITYQYFDILGRLTDSVSPEGYLTSQQYDVFGNVTDTRLFADRVIVTDESAPPVVTPDANTRHSQFVYDARDRLILETNPIGQTTAYRFDARDNRLEVIEIYDTNTQIGLRTTQYEYDKADRQVALIEAAGSADEVRSESIYNAHNEVIEQRDAVATSDERSVLFDFDKAGRMVAQRHWVSDVNNNARQHVTTFEYDEVGNLRFERAGEQDINGNWIIDAQNGRQLFQTEFQYDLENRVRFEILGSNALDQEVTESVYDAVGNKITTRIDLGGGEIIENRFVYDLDNRVVEAYDGNDVLTVYSYDAVGNRLTTELAPNTTQARLTAYTYDLADRILTVTDAEGGLTQYVYDVLGNQTLIIGADGVSQNNRFDLLGRLEVSVSEGGVKTVQRYDELGNQIESSQGWDDGLGIVSEAFAGDVRITTYEYDLRGNQTQITDPVGYSSLINYDALNRQTRVEHGHYLLQVGDAAYDADLAALQHITTTDFAYDDKDRLMIITDGLGNQTVYEYDARDNKVSVTEAFNELYNTSARSTRYVFNTANRESEVHTPEGGITTQEYDAAGRLIELRVLQSVNGATQVWTTIVYTYDGNHNLITEIDDYGTITRHGYDIANNLTDIWTAFGTSDERHVQMEYDLLNRKTADIDGEGYRTEYRIDLVGNQTQIIDAEGRRAYYYYDEGNRLVAVVDALGLVSTFAYDSAGNQTQLYAYHDSIAAGFNALTEAEKQNYSIVSALFAQNTSKDRVVNSVYDGNNRETVRVEADDSRTEFTYDGAGNKYTEITFANTQEPRTVEYRYDANNRLIEFTDVDGTLTTFAYDAANNKVLETISAGPNSIDPIASRTTRIEYDLNNREIFRVFDEGGLNIIQRQDFDKAGNQISYTDGNGAVTTYAYDLNNRITLETDAVGNTQGYGYDRVGNRTSYINGRNIEFRFAYDDNNRLTHEYLPAQEVVQFDGDESWLQSERGDLVIVHQFDAFGNEVRTIDANGNTTTRFFDANGRMTTEIQADGVYHTFTYDAYGDKVSEIIYMVPGLLSGIHSDANPLEPNPADYAAVEQRQYEYVYDKAGRLLATTLPEITVSEWNPNTLAVTDTTARLTIENVYDAFGNIILSIDQNGARTFNYFDNQDRVVASVNAEGYVTAWLYDDQDNVLVQQTYTSAIDSTFLAAMNENNRDLPINLGEYLQVNRMYDAASRMISEMQPEMTVWHQGDAAPTRTRPVTTFEYDAVGNQTRKTLAAGTAVEQNEYYIFDASNNIRAFINQGGVVHYYQYDGNNNVTVQSRYYTPINGNLANLTLNDVLNHINTQADANNDQATNFAYTAFDQVSRETNRLVGGDIVTERFYDANGNETRVILPYTASETRYSTYSGYDTMNRLIRTESPDGTGSVVEFDAVGNEISKFTGDIAFVQSTPLASEISASLADNLTINWSGGGRRFVAWSTTSQATATDLSAYNQTGITFDQDINLDIGSSDQIFFRVVSVDAGGSQSISQEFRLAIPPRVTGLNVQEQGANTVITASFNVPGGSALTPVLEANGNSYTMTPSGSAFSASLPSGSFDSYNIRWQTNGQNYETGNLSLASSDAHYVTQTDITYVGQVVDTQTSEVTHELDFVVDIPTNLAADLVAVRIAWESLSDSEINGENALIFDGSNNTAPLQIAGDDSIPLGEYRITVSGSLDQSNIVLDSFVIDLSNDGTNTTVTPASNKGLSFALNGAVANQTDIGALVIDDGLAQTTLINDGFVAASVGAGSSSYDVFIGSQVATTHTTMLTRSNVLDAGEVIAHNFVIDASFDATEVASMSGGLQLAWRAAGGGTAFTNEQAFTQAGNDFSIALNDLAPGDYDFKIFYTNTNGQEVIVDWLRADSGGAINVTSSSLIVLAKELNGDVSSDVATPGIYLGDIDLGVSPQSLALNAVANSIDFNVIRDARENGYYTETRYNALDAIVASIGQDGIVRSFKVDGVGNQVVAWEWGLERTEGAQAINIDTAMDSAALLNWATANGEEYHNIYRQYDRLNRHVLEVSQEVDIAEYQYAGDHTTGSLSINNDVRLTTQMVYDYAGNLIREIEDDGSMMEYRYNEVGIQIAEFHRNSAGSTEKGSFKQINELGKVTAEYDHLGRGKAFAFDNRGRITAEYNSRFDLSSINLSLGHDFNSAISLLTNGETEATQFGYDAFDRRTSITAAQRRNGNGTIEGVPVVKQQGYDQMNRVLTVTDAGTTQSYRYDGRGNRIEQTFPNGYRIEQRFDSFGRVVQTLHHYTRYTLNNTTVSLSSGIQTVATESFGYDIFGNQIQSTDAEGRVTSRVFGPNERLLQETDVNGVTTFYEYDDWGRQIRSYSDRPLPGTSGTTDIRRSYDERGLLTEVNDIRTNTRTTYRYNDDGLRVSEQLTINGGLERDIVYTYADNGDLTLWYDQVSGANMHYLYDTNGNLLRTEVKHFSGSGGSGAYYSRVDYTYDNANRLLSANEKFNGGSEVRRNEYSYYADGRRASWTVTNALGDAKQGTHDRNTTYHYEYNSRGLVSRSFSSQDNIEAIWQYDVNGNVTFYREKHNGNVRYQQTTRYQTNNVAYQTDTRSLDEDNNLAPNTQRRTYFDRTGREIRYYSDGESNTYGSTDYYRDGRKLREHLDGDGKIRHSQTDFQYNVNGKMTRFDKEKGSGDDRAENANFVYDNDGKIIRKNYTPPKGSISGRNLAQYYYANGKSVGQIGKAQDEPLANTKTIELGSGSYNLVDQFGRNMPGKSVSSFTAQGGETLQQVAGIFFGNPSLWYVLAEANGLSPNEPLVAGQVIEIPTHVESGRITSETHKVYSESEIIGNTTPNVKQKSNKCASFIMIIIAVIIVVVAAIFLGPLAGAIAPAFAGLGATAATVLSYAVAGAILGAVSSIVTQGVAILLDLQDGFDWGRVGQDALAGALSGAASGLGQAAKVAEAGSNLAKYGKVASRALQAASAAVKSLDENGKVTSWTSVVAAYITGPSGPQLNGSIGPIFSAGEATQAFLQYGTPWLSLVETYVREGELDTEDWLTAIASTVGSFIDSKIAGDGVQQVAQRSALKALAGGAIGSFSDDPDFAFDLVSNSVGNEIGTFLGNSIIDATGLRQVTAKAAREQQAAYFENNPDAYEAYQKQTLNSLVNVIARDLGEDSAEIQKLRAGIESGELSLEVLLKDLNGARGVTEGLVSSIDKSLVNSGAQNGNSAALAFGAAYEEIFEKLFNFIDPTDDLAIGIGDEGGKFAKRYLQDVIAHSGQDNLDLFLSNGKGGIYALSTDVLTLSNHIESQFSNSRLENDYSIDGLEFQLDLPSVKELFETLDMEFDTPDERLAYIDYYHDLFIEGQKTAALANKLYNDSKAYEEYAQLQVENDGPSLEYFLANKHSILQDMNWKAVFQQQLAGDALKIYGQVEDSSGFELSRTKAATGTSVIYKGLTEEQYKAIAFETIDTLPLSDVDGENILETVLRGIHDTFNDRMTLTDATPRTSALIVATEAGLIDSETAHEILENSSSLSELGKVALNSAKASVEFITGTSLDIGEIKASIASYADIMAKIEEKAKSRAGFNIHDFEDRFLLNKAIKLGLKVSNATPGGKKIKAIQRLGKRLADKIPGGNTVIDHLLELADLPTGDKTEMVVQAVLHFSGQFQEVERLQNRSGQGVDVIVKTKDGEWVPFEVKGSARNRFNPLSKGPLVNFRHNQNAGASAFTSERLHNIADRGFGFTTARQSQVDLAERILEEQAKFNREHRPLRRADSFEGYVIQARNINRPKKVQTRIWEWEPNRVNYRRRR